LTTVRGFLQILSEKIESDNFQEYFQLMIQELDRATGIITEFLSLAKNKPISLEIKDLNRIIYALSPLIEANAIVANQTFNIQTEEIPPLKVDEKEIRQLILNLARNAIEAMGESGHLLLKSERTEDEVILSVKDTGPGIEPNVLEKLGTPFVSTKANGTGLGLAVCYSIALRHNAVIQVNSAPSGTTFMVRFKI
jgi:signal transduction histidine kinase